MKAFALAHSRRVPPFVLFVAAAIAALLTPTLAFAGTGGAEFAPLYTKIKGYSQGILGKVISLMFFLVGMGIGIVRQSVIAVVVGVGAALVLVYGPDVIDAMFTATFVLSGA